MKQNLGQKKLLSGKDNKLYIKWKNYNSFNGWIDEKNTVIQNEIFSKTIQPQ